MMDEPELLARFVADGSPEAFAELLRRNIDLVYAAARRQLHDAHLADDVTQAVFILLTRRAASIKGSAADWLIAATYYACSSRRHCKRCRRCRIPER